MSLSCRSCAWSPLTHVQVTTDLGHISYMSCNHVHTVSVNIPCLYTLTHDRLRVCESAHQGVGRGGQCLCFQLTLHLMVF